MSIQAVLIEVGAVLLLGSSITLVRLRLLSIRYGLGWITVSLIGLIVGPVLTPLAEQVKRLGFTETGFSLGVFITFLGLLCLQLSISLSGLHHAIQDLAEHAALVEARLRRLEEAERSEVEAHAEYERIGEGL
jgi:hypothetical protein